MQTLNYAENGWVSLKESARYAGVSKRLIEQWEKTGKITVARVIIPGNQKGRVLVKRESLDRFIESYVGTPPHAAPVNRNREGAR